MYPDYTSQTMVTWINMDAVSIVMSFMIVFFANATGTQLPYSLLAIVLLSNTLLSIGASGVPNSAIASFAALAVIAGLPTGIMGMYVSVNIDDFSRSFYMRFVRFAYTPQG